MSILYANALNYSKFEQYGTDTPFNASSEEKGFYNTSVAESYGYLTGLTTTEQYLYVVIDYYWTYDHNILDFGAIGSTPRVTISTYYSDSTDYIYTYINGTKINTYTTSPGNTGGRDRWNHLMLKFDLTNHTGSVYIDKTLIVENLSISGDFSAFTALRLYPWNYTSRSRYMYIKNVIVADEDITDYTVSNNTDIVLNSADWDYDAESETYSTSSLNKSLTISADKAKPMNKLILDVLPAEVIVGNEIKLSANGTTYSANTWIKNIENSLTITTEGS